MTSERNENESTGAMYESLFEEIGMALYVLDGEERFVRIAPLFEKLTGYSQQDLAGKPFKSIVFSGIDAAVDGLFRGGEGVALKREMFIMKKDAAPVTCMVACIKMNASGEGKYVGVIVPKQQPDPEMEEKVRVFAMAVEQSPATVVITDRQGSIEYVNPKFTSLTGYTFNEALRHNPRILKSGMQSREFYDDLWQTITSGKEWRGDFHNRKKNGEVYWESASISPIINNKGEITHFVAVKEDITDRKKAEEEIRIAGAILKERNDEMVRELADAQVVTAMLLPGAPPEHDRLRAAFRFKPLEAIGGDFFSFNTLHEHRVGVFIGDVAGHGVSAALFLTLLRSLTDRLNGAVGTSPSGYLKGLNGALIDGGVFFFITALYGVFDLAGDGAAFRFAKGGHMPPILHRAGAGSAEVLWSGGIPVGLSGSAEFQEITVDLKPGDRIYLYTDGVTEIRNEKGEMIEPEGLRDMIARSGSMGLEESLDHIVDEAGRFQGAKTFEDDIIIIGFEVIY
ncbi:MAG TPA: SpoIIE family protein phosphatase [Spirochaetota bacterium]|nr:SpoIIE family protein phosphatase [Spirochaetota bacterium]HPC42785.1 SpoIIE family protein phosphatase [Spirochaetota bacterium]HPL15978.1 SpoIIE family protein phosphatase [Spirochaetota bacterium]HQF09012.1 SpoIIE family protein phosphatase [Spirochaetota bacterium]HQH97900.1 SpoIIE family protein phosphatase [Spirochaetota bacterium]